MKRLAVFVFWLGPGRGGNQTAKRLLQKGVRPLGIQGV
jgi:hypothetical protein